MLRNYAYQNNNNIKFKYITQKKIKNNQININRIITTNDISEDRYDRREHTNKHTIWKFRRKPPAIARAATLVPRGVRYRFRTQGLATPRRRGPLTAWPGSILRARHANYLSQSKHLLYGPRCARRTCILSCVFVWGVCPFFRWRGRVFSWFPNQIWRF